MAVTASQHRRPTPRPSPWEGFQPGLWQKEINVRDFIQQNYDAVRRRRGFLAPATDAHAGRSGSS